MATRRRERAAASPKARRAPRLSDLAAVETDEQHVNAVIETPKGGRTKVAYDPDRDAFVVKRVLPQGLSFPFDYGFIPSTLGDDGDPLDVVVLMDEPVASGTIVPCRLIGVIEALQTEQSGKTDENDRLIGVSGVSELFAEVKKLGDLPESITREVEQFFVAYNKEEGKRFEPTGRRGRKRAERLLENGRRKYRHRASKG